jgi:pimeloyl-ACP methyl ester carboxylesterase
LALAAPLGVPRLLGFPPGVDLYEKASPSVRAMARAKESRTAAIWATVSEFDAWEVSMDQVRAASRSLGDLPLVVLTRGSGEPETGVQQEEAAEINRDWNELQEDLTRLSTHSRRVVVEDSGHFIQMDCPVAVIDAVRMVVEEARQTAGGLTRSR